MKKAIKLIVVIELAILATFLISFSVFMNVQIAFLSSFFIILGSAYAYKRMVVQKVENDEIDEKRDLLDEIEDPHELYSETPLNEASADELDLKAIVKEEKAKIKTFSAKSMKYGTKAGFSLFRLLPYIFLVLGFIGLKNNELLALSIYLPSLLVGIIIGYFISKEVF